MYIRALWLQGNIKAYDKQDDLLPTLGCLEFFVEFQKEFLISQKLMGRSNNKH